MKLVFDVLLLNSLTQLLLKSMMNLDWWALVFVTEKPNGEAPLRYLGNLSLSKDIGNE